MNDDDIFGDLRLGEQHANPPVHSLEPEEPDYGAGDYVRLPNCGRNHYSLDDAAVLGALDWWLEGAIAEFPVGERGVYDQDEPAVRTGIAPTRQRIQEMLVNEVESGRLKAQVFARNLSNSRIVAERTYVHFDDFVDCMGTYGHPPGEYLFQIASDEAEAEHADAEGVARDRARLRYGGTFGPEKVSAVATVERPDLYWKRIASERTLQIAQLQAQLAGRPAATSPPLGVREKRTLLALIAVLCKEAKLDYKTAPKTADMLHATAVGMGVDLGLTTIKNKLREIPNALGTRMK